MADDAETTEVGSAFAAMMSDLQAQAQPQGAEPWLNPDGSHKYGSHPDGSPKKAMGRPRKSPSLDDLKAAKDEAVAPEVPQDRAPDPKAGKGKGKGAVKPPVDYPQHRPGLITKGMNKRYRQLGKLIRPLDRDIGQAFITMTVNTSDVEDEDNSVGACWDDVARVNPRIRKFCLAVIQGGAYGALILAHAPLGIAIALKFVSNNPGFIGKVILSMAEPEPDAPEGEGGLPFGLTAEDAATMMQMAGPLLEQMQAANGSAPEPAANGPPRPPRNQQFARHGQGKRR